MRNGVAGLSLRIIFLAIAGASAWSSPNSFLIDVNRIVATLSQRDLPVSPNQVQLLANVRSTQENPDLEVMTVMPWQQASVKVRVRCRQREACLPFYVIVTGRTLAEITRATHPGGATPPTDSTRTVAAAHGPLLVRAGDRATLVIMNQHMLIQLPVVCLANGGEGKQIRVASTDHKQIYLAEVVGSELLKGSL